MHKLLFVTTNFIGLDEIIKKNLEKHYEVDTLIYSFENQKFKYKNVFQRLTNLYRKKVLKDRNYKNVLKNRFENQKLIETFKARNKEYDVVLIFSLEYFTDNLLRVLKSKTKRMIAYQWDGLKRTPNIYDKIKYFDKFFAFDPNDVDEKKIFLATNFYLDIPKIDDISSQNITSDIGYIGTVWGNRLEKLIELILEFRKIDKVLKTSLLYTPFGIIEAKKTHPFKELEYIENTINYADGLKLVLQSKVILDLKLDVHDGLSFRFFEAMKYRKKIITDNSTIVNYDFYNPNNIFILGVDNLSNLKNFIEQEYQDLSLEIVKKYSFSEWLKRILE